ncbi:DinB family protein [Pseudooceanicola sp. CBS1P-1]|uniref:Nuclease n=1 Tax=Pseudooceanicola albus TaxID=2692189 RepID=A0A6L7G392_9RHOB|nr:MULTISPECIES: DinB family protein [Pseudooceanicola]MBT9384770.1 DinB family protein [Pseudooceanicola endophyticus]MXN18471.1 nuclease [Pseudooceanicola albus]
MDLLSPFRQMARNNAWANATLHGALSGMDAAAFAAPRAGFFGSLKETLNHIHQVDLYYIDALEEGGRGRSVYDAPEIALPGPLALAQAEADARLIRFCDALRPADLEAPRLTRRPERDVQESVGALLLHLFQHQVHHRGQAHVQLHQAGIAPPQLDEFFLDDDRAPSARAYFD